MNEQFRQAFISNKYIAKAIISPINNCLTKEQEQRQQTDLETIENLGSASRSHDFSKKIHNFVKSALSLVFWILIFRNLTERMAQR